MFGPIFEPMLLANIKTLTVADLDIELNSVDDSTTLSDIDDDINFDVSAGNDSLRGIYRELPQNNFNIRTLTQDKIEEMKRNSNTGWIPRI